MSEQTGLQIESAGEFQQRMWLAQRVGWGLMAAFILAALAGWFGSGPASSQTATASDGSLSVEYEKFSTRKKPQTLRLEVQPEANDGGELRIRVSAEYLREVEIERIVPTPSKAILDQGALTYVFPVAKARQEAVITLYVRPDRIGATSGWVGLEGAEPVRIQQFVYP